MARRRHKPSLQEIRQALARRCLEAFMLQMNADYQMGWFHRRICEELDMFLQAVAEKRSPRLMIAAPPRHGKSQIASRCFPAYALGRYPDLSIIAASYSADLSSRMNRDVQRIIDSPEYAALFPETSLSGTNVRTVAQGSYLRNSDIFEVVGHRGVYRSAGVGGGITGMGAECVDADSQILMRYGCVRASDVVPGMKICAYDFASKRIRQCTVLAVKHRRVPLTYSVRAGRHVLHATGNHPVYADGQFTPVERLQDGAELLCSDSLNIGWGERLSVQKTKLESVSPDCRGIGRTVVDIQVADCHNFFANGILVHNCAIIDDPVKDRAEADSPTISKSVWDWYTSTLYTRLAPGGGIIIIQTRWSENDLSGRLLEAQAQDGGDEWRIVSFPAIAETDEEFRKAGEALHPERYPLDQLVRIKKAIGERDWAALYQQRPAPEGGAIFRKEWLERTWTRNALPNRFDAFAMSWDMAFKGADTSDFVVGQLYGKAGSDYYLLDQERGRWSFTESVEAVRRLSAKAQRYTKHPVRILIEDKANGPAVIDMMKKELSGIIPVKPDGSKESRAHAVTALFEGGNVVLPHPSEAPWIGDFKAELLSFPAGAHDDQVDACTQAIRWLSSGNRLAFAPELKQRLAPPLMMPRRR